MNYNYKAGKYKNKIHHLELSQDTEGGAAFFRSKPLEITVMLPDSNRHVTYHIDSKHQIATVGDLISHLRKDRSFRDYGSELNLFRYYSGDFSSLVGTTIKIQRQGFNPTYRKIPKVPGVNSPDRVLTSRNSSNEKLLCYVNNKYENFNKSNKHQLIDGKYADTQISDDRYEADDYVCQVTSYDPDTDTCVCRRGILDSKTVYKASNLMYKYNDELFTKVLDNNVNLKDLVTPDFKATLVVYNPSNIETQVKIVNNDGDVGTYTRVRDGTNQLLTILDIKHWLAKRDGYRLKDMSLYQEGVEEALANTSSLDGISYLFLLRTDPMVEGQHLKMKVKLMLNTLEVYQDTDDHGNQRQVTEVRNLVTQVVNVHQSINDVMEKLLEKNPTIERFTPQDASLETREGGSFRDWYQRAKLEGYVFKRRGKVIDPKTVLSDFRAGWDKKKQEYDKRIVIRIYYLEK